MKVRQPGSRFASPASEQELRERAKHFTRTGKVGRDGVKKFAVLAQGRFQVTHINFDALQKLPDAGKGKKETMGMKKAYWVVSYQAIHDPAALAAYAPLAVAAIAAGGGAALVRGLPHEVDGRGIKERTVVVEFPSLQAAVDTHHSDAYKQALAALGNGVDRDFRIVEGV